MQVQEHRITFRIKKGELAKIQIFIKQNYPKVKNVSQVVRLAIDEFFAKSEDA